MYMAYEQNAGQSHIMYIANKSENVTESNIWECHKQIKTVFKRKWRADEFCWMLAPFSSESCGHLLISLYKNIY